MSQHTIVISKDQAGRIDVALAAAFPQVGRRRLAELFAAGSVRVGGRIARKGDRVSAGAVVALAMLPVGREGEQPQADPAAAARLSVLLARADFVAVDKPAPMPSLPLRAGELGSAANGLAALYPECAAIGNDPRDGGVVHRLDTGTTGVLIAARTEPAYRQLREAFSSGHVTKTYLAITSARPVASSCSASLSQRGRRVVVDEQDGLSAHTDVEVLAPLPGSRVPTSNSTVSGAVAALCLVRCTARSGRMHQVRAHLAALRAPILGDTLYGLYGAPVVAELAELLAAGEDGRFVLHAESVTMILGDDTVVVTAPLPAAVRSILDTAGLLLP